MKINRAQRGDAAMFVGDCLWGNKRFLLIKKIRPVFTSQILLFFWIKSVVDKMDFLFELLNKLNCTFL